MDTISNDDMLKKIKHGITLLPVIKKKKWKLDKRYLEWEGGIA